MIARWFRSTPGVRHQIGLCVTAAFPFFCFWRLLGSGGHYVRVRPGYANKNKLLDKERPEGWYQLLSSGTNFCPLSAPEERWGGTNLLRMVPSFNPRLYFLAQAGPKMRAEGSPRGAKRQPRGAHRQPIGAKTGQEDQEGRPEKSNWSCKKSGTRTAARVVFTKSVENAFLKKRKNIGKRWLRRKHDFDQNP